MTDDEATGSRTPEHLGHRVSTRGGRVLAVAERDDPNRIPLFALQGTPEAVRLPAERPDRRSSGSRQ